MSNDAPKLPVYRPLLERMARGEEVARAEVLEAYRHVHGMPPSEEEWPRR